MASVMIKMCKKRHKIRLYPLFWWSQGYPEGLRQVKNPYYFPDDIGDNGSDFTVGAVFVNKRIGNFFKGEIGGLAVYDRALTADEVKMASWWKNE